MSRPIPPHSEPLLANRDENTKWVVTCIYRYIFLTMHSKHRSPNRVQEFQLDHPQPQSRKGQWCWTTPPGGWNMREVDRGNPSSIGWIGPRDWLGISAHCRSHTVEVMRQIFGTRVHNLHFAFLELRAFDRSGFRTRTTTFGYRHRNTHLWRGARWHLSSSIHLWWRGTRWHPSIHLRWWMGTRWHHSTHLWWRGHHRLVWWRGTRRHQSTHLWSRETRWHRLNRSQDLWSSRCSGRCSYRLGCRTHTLRTADQHY